MEASPDSKSSIPVAVDPIARRVSAVLHELSGMMHTWKNDDPVARLTAIATDAIIEEITEDAAVFAFGAPWLIQFAELMRWTATGDPTALTDEMLAFACKIDGLDLDLVKQVIAARQADVIMGTIEA